MLGQILGARRKEIVLATKFGMAMDDAETRRAPLGDTFSRRSKPA